MKTRTALRLAALALVVGLPCSAAIAQSDSTPSSSNSWSSTSTSPAINVELISAGDGNKQLLRYQPQIGQRQVMKMTVNMSIQASSSSNPAPTVAVPPVTLELAMTPSEIFPTGDIAYTTDIVSAEVASTSSASPAIVESMKKTLNSVVGISGNGVMTARGFNTKLAFELPAGADDSVLQTMQNTERSIAQLGAPFPEQPVGVGASWKVITDSNVNSMAVRQTSTYTLEAIDGDKLTLSVTVAQAADRQPIATPNMPSNYKAELLSLQGDGSGRQTFVLSSLVPTAAQFDLKTTTDLNLDHGTGSGMQMQQTMTMAVAIESDAR